MAQRREIRETVLQALYSEEVGKNEWEQILNSFLKSKLKSDKEEYKFAEQLFLKTLNNSEEIDKVIEQHINNWKIERLNVMDKIIIRMAICEFLFFEQIPTKVTINEAIEIGKRFSTSKSGNFINGILDASLADLKKNNRVEKKGRGLIESSINE